MRSLFKIRQVTAPEPAQVGSIASPDSGLSLTFALVVASGIMTMGLLAGRTDMPLQLIALSALAACGLFFILASALGRVKIAARAPTAAAQSLADAWPEAVLVTTRLGADVYMNPAFQRLTGGAENGLQALEARFAGDRSASEALFRLARAAERSDSHSEEFDIRSGGLRRAFRLTISPLDIDDFGAGPLMLWRLTDITREREQAVLKAGMVESRLHVFDAAPVGLISVRPDLTVAEMNATLTQWRASGPAALDMTVTLDLLFHRPGGEVLKRMLERQGAGPVQCSLDLVTHGGRRLPVRVMSAARPASGGAGGDDRVLAIVRADTAESAAPADQINDPGFASHFRSAPFGIATITAGGHIVRSNPAFAHMALDGTGGIEDAVLDVLCRDTPSAERAAVGQAIADALAGQASAAPVDFSSGPKGDYGRRVYVTPLPNAAASREAAIVYVVDTTEQKALEAKFAQSQKMDAVGKLAGGIAHDFNNVLTAIIGSADLMLQTHRATDAAHKDIQNIKHCAHRAAGLVGKLMAFSRQQTLQLEALQLGDALTDLRPMLKTSLGETISLKVTTDRDLWYVKADRTQIDQVLVNLAVNAQHAMPNGGMFSVRTRNITEREAQIMPYAGLQTAEYVLIEVEDTGTGMPPEVQAKVFEPFFTTKEVGKGTGLGLATVYGIIKQFSGFIFLESTVGVGTTFKIFLPRAHVDHEIDPVAQKAARKDAKPADLTGTATVLIVEDEDMVRSVAVRSLTRLGYTVLEAGNGYEALDVLAGHDGVVDIVVSDVVMPEMDGPTFLKEVRKTQPSLKIIFVSGHTNDAFKATVGENEVFAFLPKPFSLPQLAAKVKEQLGN